MAYFPNGTAGAVLEEQCHTCIHGLKEDTICPVALAQMTYNYEQTNNPNLEGALNLLVDERGTCLMKTAMQLAGIVFDFSGRDQLGLF